VQILLVEDEIKVGSALTLVHWELEEKDGVTTVRLTHSGLTDESSRTSHRGWPQILGWLQAYVEQHVRSRSVLKRYREGKRPVRDHAASISPAEDCLTFVLGFMTALLWFCSVRRCKCRLPVRDVGRYPAVN
jgi:hypothetical protein